MKHFYPDRSGLFQDKDAPIHRGHWMVWSKCEWCESYSVAFTVTRSQPSWTPMEDFGLTCSPLSRPPSKHQMREYLLEEQCSSLQSSSETCRINAKAHWSCSVGTLWPNTFLWHFMLVFPFICHPSAQYVRTKKSATMLRHWTLQCCSCMCERRLCAKYKARLRWKCHSTYTYSGPLCVAGDNI